MAFHLAQVNIARAKAPLDSPLMAEFINALDKVNAVADSSPGFVWRLQTDDGNAIAVRAYDDPRVIFNMSVWESVAALKDYVYRSMHGDVFARRQDWFEKMDAPHMAMWWIPTRLHTGNCWGQAAPGASGSSWRVAVRFYLSENLRS